MSTIRREIAIAAPAVTVFEYFVDPARMTKWMGINAELEARPGGVFRVAINSKSVVKGAYVTVDPPHRVVFTWGWEAADELVQPGSSEVEITLREVDGKTHVAVEHRGLPNDDEAHGHGEGWDHFLGRLASVGAGDDPGPDPWAAS